jgi:hypothetical protein
LRASLALVSITVLGVALTAGVVSARTVGGGLPPVQAGMVHRARAIVLARNAARPKCVPGTPIVFRSARYTTYGKIDRYPVVLIHGTYVSRPDLPVWSIVFTGEFPPPSCGPPGAKCPPPNRSIEVVLNARTGAFLTATSPAPKGA